MDQSEIKLVIEAALLAAGRPLPLDKIVELFSAHGDGIERAAVREALEALAADYESRGIELKEVSSGYRVQVRASMSGWLQPLWEERAPRYTRALLETLALIAYRQPITRGEIEEVRGVAVSSNIVRTLMERGWVRVVGHREVPGKPAMLGTTREFLDYFGLKKLEELPTLAELQDESPRSSPQGDFIEALHPSAEGPEAGDGAPPEGAAAAAEQGGSADYDGPGDVAADDAATPAALEDSAEDVSAMVERLEAGAGEPPIADDMSGTAAGPLPIGDEASETTDDAVDLDDEEPLAAEDEQRAGADDEPGSAGSTDSAAGPAAESTPEPGTEPGLRRSEPGGF